MLIASVAEKQQDILVGYVSYVSSEKAARLLLVSQATVLKWIEQNKLKARKTADERYLVSRESVQELLNTSSALIEQIINGTRPILSCWEYNAENGKIKEDCLSCPVFQTRKKKCYQVGKFLKESGQGASCCPTDCEDCSYYKYQKQISEGRSLPPVGKARKSSNRQTSN
ncbi:MAG: helix-turn-helix domain-containing protein [Candidatus Binatia bacterium]